jgi:hypothetical protein
MYEPSGDFLSWWKQMKAEYLIYVAWQVEVRTSDAINQVKIPSEQFLNRLLMAAL